MPDTPDDGSGPNIGGIGGGYTSRPIPDPTVLTTQALYREVSALRELIEQRIVALRESVNESDEAIRASIEEAIEARTILDEEVQKRTDLQFRLVEQQRVEQKKDTKDAVDAALTAQKEAVKEQTTASERAIAKSETATNKQLEELGKRFETAVENLRRVDDENKERIADVDRKASAVVSEKTGSLDTRTLVLGLVAAAGVIYAIISARGG